MAIARARLAIASVALAYAASVVAGIAMVNAGDASALAQRDQIVGRAQSSPIVVADRSGDRVRAALLDFSSNLVLGGLTSTAFGITVVGLYPTVAYRGWIGGIVSVDRDHRSRLADTGSAVYYLVTLVLQLIPYSIAGGMGVRLGVASWRRLRRPVGTAWLGLPIEPLRDTALAYLAIAPLFLIASLWEFLAPRG